MSILLLVFKLTINIIKIIIQFYQTGKISGVDGVNCLNIEYSTP